MADSTGTIVKVGLFAGAAFLAYRWFLAPADVPATAPPATSPKPDTTPAVKETNTYNTASALLSRMTDAAKAAGMTTGSPDQWNVIFNQVGGPGPAPDPISLFGSRDEITLAQYWAHMSAWLATNKGLTGFGVYAGLGRLVYFRRAV